MIGSTCIASRHACLLFILALSVCGARASCGSDFCAINTQWDTHGLSKTEGFSLDLRYSQARADQLRAGSTRIRPEAPSGSDAEIEDRRTINNLLNIDTDYAINERWSVAMSVPIVMRDHSHTFDSSISGPFQQQAKFTAIGDMRVIAKYQLSGSSLTGGGGIRFGLKLPTGSIDKTMSPADPANPSTPYRLERSGQPGSGSTDVVLGLYRFGGAPASNWGWFISGEMQAAAATRDNYRPGRLANLDLGLNYAFSSVLSGTVQLNAKHRARDSGSNANVASGGRTVGLGPGLVLSVTPQTKLYGFLQKTLRQTVNTDSADPASGQLTAPGAVAIGINHSF